MKKFPPLRGGGYCRDAWWAIVIITIFIIVGFVILAAAGAVYNNDNNDTTARQAIYAGAVILACGILCCISAICDACTHCTDHCCGCHFICCRV
jgi:hypothetical protein